jgi:hypothetical protein
MRQVVMFRDHLNRGCPHDCERIDHTAAIPKKALNKSPAVRSTRKMRSSSSCLPSAAHLPFLRCLPNEAVRNNCTSPLIEARRSQLNRRRTYRHGRATGDSLGSGRMGAFCASCGRFGDTRSSTQNYRNHLGCTNRCPASPPPSYSLGH